MGIVYDCLWYYRQESDGIPDPYQATTRTIQPGEDAAFNPLDSLHNCPQTMTSASILPETQFPLMTDINTFLPEWEWFLPASEFVVQE